MPYICPITPKLKMKESSSSSSSDRTMSPTSLPPLSRPIEWIYRWTIVCAAMLYIFTSGANQEKQQQQQQQQQADPRRRLSLVEKRHPSYMDPLMQDLKERQTLFEDTPPEQVRYWFEYTGSLQKYYFYHPPGKEPLFFTGRDDSGVTSSRYVDKLMGSEEHSAFFQDDTNELSSQHLRLLENCLAMGAPSSKKGDDDNRCRILFTINTAGAGSGRQLLWETNPPPNDDNDKFTTNWSHPIAHLQRNLQEIDALCSTGNIVARVQVLVCQPISAYWTEWMDSQLPNCGGGLVATDMTNADRRTATVENRPSPLQMVVVATHKTAQLCLDQKSGFMEQRMQDLILAPPYLDGKSKKQDPAIKSTSPFLVSSEDHDLYVALKWTSLVTIRAIHSFLQASADLTAAGAASPNPPLSSSYGIPIPSFVRVSYLSNESRKASKYRLHGDYFHPAAWEICKDSYETAWIKNSLSGSGGANGLCYNNNGGNGQQEKKRSRRLDRPSDDCGQWWIQMTESQVPTEPEVYANQRTPPVVKGGSNFFWIVTELQRREIVKRHICLHENKKDKTANVRCPLMPHAVIPLGDMESFMINFTPNTALGWAHDDSFRPGYTREKERELELEKVESRETITSAIIEEALYDYTVYPVALMRKEATLKAVRSQDAVLSKQPQEKEGSLFALPRMVKSSYYDITFTKPRPPILGWCQAIARKGLCTLYSDYFRAFKDLRCVEACGMKRDWTLIDEEGQ